MSKQMAVVLWQLGQRQFVLLETIGNKFAGQIEADSGWTNIFIKRAINLKLLMLFN